MLKVLFISDFTESFANNILKGIADYSRQKDQWSICRMPLHYKNKIGIEGVVRWAKEWGVDAVIGTFDITDNLSLFRDEGIIVVAQDYKTRFKTVPNLTSDYRKTGRMAAEFYMDRGFSNFGFFGLTDVCWSDERRDGFKETVVSSGPNVSFHEYIMKEEEHRWFYDKDSLVKWLHDLPKPIGILACDDNQGNNLIEACHSAGIEVPEEISIIGVDNDNLLCDISVPTLSSIQIDIEQGGFMAAKMIDALVHNPDMDCRDIVMKPIRIIERVSTASFAKSDPEIQKAIRFIHQNKYRKISVQDVMGEVALSRRLLERRFKSVTGKAVYQYISELRLKAFADMLQESTEPVVNIALHLGETDVKSISKRFKAVYGYTPNEWRQIKSGKFKG